MEPLLINLLHQSLYGNYESITNSFSFIEALSLNEDFVPCLMSISLSGVSIQIRQASVICLKNLIKTSKKENFLFLPNFNFLNFLKFSVPQLLRIQYEEIFMII